MTAEIAEPVEAIRMNSGILRIPRAARTRSNASSADLDLERYVSQELIQNQKEGHVQKMQHGAQVVSQPYASLNDGHKIPLIGLGTFKSTDEVMDEAVAAALRYGVRHIDCAEHYGNEPAIGRALNKAFKAGFAKREDTFVTSKLWNTDHAAADVKPALLKTLRDLQLEYLDLYLIHWPVTEPQVPGDEITPSLQETWAAMEELVDQGLVRSIGISNSSIKCIERLLKTARIRPAVNQVEIHPHWRNDELREYCEKEGIHVSAYCPLGTPSTSAKAVIRRAQSVSSVPLVKQIAAKYKKHVLSLLLRWGIQRGNSVLAKSSNPHHIRGNLEGCLGWTISPEDMQKLSTLDFQLRLVDGIRFLRPEGPFRNMNDMWDEEWTEVCRQKFINRMYKFPTNPTYTLNMGAKMPVLGFGTWKNQQVSNVVQRALRRGLRHIDCSSQPDNEEEIGKAMAEICGDWIVNRPDIFVTVRLQESSPEKMAAAAQASLDRLQTKYVDLLLLPADHIESTAKLEASWRVLESIVENGGAKAIGLISASMSQIKSILGFCKIKPAVNSVEVHPACRNDRIISFCRSKGLHVMASSWPATAYMLHKKDAPALLSEPTVLETASRMNKHASQVLIRWAIQHGHSVSPKACSDVHLQGILDVLNWQLPKEDYQALCDLPQDAPQKNLEDMEPDTDSVKYLDHLTPPQL